MSPATGWSLVAALLVVIAAIVWLTARWRINAFLVLIMASFAFGLCGNLLTGRPGLIEVKQADGTITDGLVKVVAGGFGGTLASIGLVILFGTILGYFLEKSGAAFVMAESILRWVGKRRAPLALGLAGYIISIPVFCDSGFIVLASLNRALAAEAGLSLSVTAISLSMGLYATHTMVPPTPGAMAAAGTLGADIGLVMVLGLVVALPTTLAGVGFAHWIASRYHIEPRPRVSRDQIALEYGRLPSPLASFLPILTPVFLIALGSLANLPSHPFGTDGWKRGLSFAGNPVIALCCGVTLAALAVPLWNKSILDGWVAAAIKDAALILVITASGGSLGAVIRATGLGDFLGETLSKWHLGLLLPFLIAAAIKTAQGSSTVSLVTTSAILAPLLPALGWTSPSARALAVLATGAGSMVLSHANDSYFWVVSQFSDMDVPTAVKTQTLASLVTGLVALATVLLLSTVLL
jgi:gluconate:H+ symporter, GntP family